MTSLRTRRPTGTVAWPLILVEGEEKSGRSYAALQLSASPRVGRTFVLDLGDGTADEYAALGDYEILEHDGTWTSIIDQLEAACAIPPADDRPNVIVVDSCSAVWQLLKAWTDQRARTSRTGAARLRDDPDASIDPAMNLWNDAKDRWARMLNLLKAWPGVAVLTALGREVARVENGQPVAGQVEWSIEAEKSTPAVVSAWVRLRRPHKATLIGARSLFVDVPVGGVALPDHNMLDHLIFDVLGGGGFGPSTAVLPAVGVPIVRAKQRLVEAVLRAQPGLSGDDARRVAAGLWEAANMPRDGEVLMASLASLLELTRPGVPTDEPAPTVPPEGPPASPPDPESAPDPEVPPEPPEPVTPAEDAENAPAAAGCPDCGDTGLVEVDGADVSCPTCAPFSEEAPREVSPVASAINAEVDALAEQLALAGAPPAEPVETF